MEHAKLLLLAAAVVLAASLPLSADPGVTIIQPVDVALPSPAATQPTPQEPKVQSFLLVKVKGAIGEDFTAAKMKAALAEARKAKVAAVVLSMDTPGGSVAEAEAIVNLIIENKDLRFIALVRKALSAGATITLACKDIYVMETATIGAAVSYIPDRRGIPVVLPADVAEKFQSAWRAVCRKAADHGGHSSLLAEGMADRGFAITMRTENGKVILERDGKGEVLKAKGKILTLTAKEAVACGLAKVVVPNVADLGGKLGMPNWKRLGGVDLGKRDDRPTVKVSGLRGLLYKYVNLPVRATDAAVKAHLEEMKAEAQERKAQAPGKPRGKKRSEGIQISPEKEGRKIATIRARAAGTSRRYLEAATRLRKEAPKRLEAVESGEKTMSQVLREEKREKTQAKLAALPPDKYRVVYADPPWSYGNSGAIGDADAYSRVARHYPAMSIAELCALDVKALAADNAVLFLWVTSPLLAECWPVIKAWGFTYRASIIWNKAAHNFGHYVSVQHELLLICVRGSCTPDTKKLLPSVVTHQRGKHSEKPEVFRDMIDTIYPIGKRLELFARKEPPCKWDGWGNEKEGD